MITIGFYFPDIVAIANDNRAVFIRCILIVSYDTSGIDVGRTDSSGVPAICEFRASCVKSN